MSQKRSTGLKMASTGILKVKQRSYSVLKRHLDKVFSQYIRRKAADSQGFVRCITCGSRAHWKQMQCGHFIPRHYLAGRWNEDNCAVQDASCNVWGRGRYPEFAKWGLQTYGPDWVDRMVALKRKSVKFSRSDLQQMIEEYQGKIEELVMLSS